VKLLEVSGFEAAEQYITKQNPREQELYLVLERARLRLQDMPLSEVKELADSADRLAILRDLRAQVDETLGGAARLAQRPSRPSGLRPRLKGGPKGRVRAVGHA
jgi:hypothetical protein